MERYVPDSYKKDIYEVNYEQLRDCGIKCLLFDLDNTLVPRFAKHATEELKELFEQLQKDFRVIIFTNAIKQRAMIFKDQLNVEIVYCAKKPNPNAYVKIMKKHKLDQNEVCAIGDQIMTDIFGANNAGITSVLIEPSSKKEDIWTKVNRLRERNVVHKLNRRDLFFRGRYYDK